VTYPSIVVVKKRSGI